MTYIITRHLNHKFWTIPAMWDQMDISITAVHEHQLTMSRKSSNGTEIHIMCVHGKTQ